MNCRRRQATVRGLRSTIDPGPGGPRDAAVRPNRDVARSVRAAAAGSLCGIETRPGR